MDEDFLDVTKSSKKIAIIFTISVLAIFILGYFWVNKNIGFSLKTIEVELGDSLNEEVKFYLKKETDDIQNFKLNLSKVKTDEPGTYTYTVTHNRITKKGKIKISDTTPPKFTTRDMTIEEGDEEYFLGDFLETCEDISKPCIVTLKNDKDEKKFSEIGKHEIDIVVSDVYGNKKNATTTLIVVEKGKYVDERTTDLTYYSNSKKLDSIEGKIYLMLDKALKQDSEESSDQMSTISSIDLEKYVSTNYEGYKLLDSEIIELYNKYQFVIGYSIELKISNGTEKTIYVEKTKILNIEENDSQEHVDTD